MDVSQPLANGHRVTDAAQVVRGTGCFAVCADTLGVSVWLRTHGHGRCRTRPDMR